jgi:hypothetical protein
MKCVGCPASAEGLAVIPGVGEAGEIRFYCDACARRDRVKMRYWDGRDLDVGGWRERPDLGPSFSTLVFGFEDLARMRPQDLEPVFHWLDDAEIAAALSGAEPSLVEKAYAVLPLGTAPARELFVSVVRRL